MLFGQQYNMNQQPTMQGNVVQGNPMHAVNNQMNCMVLQQGVYSILFIFIFIMLTI